MSQCLDSFANLERDETAWPSRAPEIWARRARHYDILKDRQSISRVQAFVLQNVRVRGRPVTIDMSQCLISFPYLDSNEAAWPSRAPEVCARRAREVASATASSWSNRAPGGRVSRKCRTFSPSTSGSISSFCRAAGQASQDSHSASHTCPPPCRQTGGWTCRTGYCSAQGLMCGILGCEWLDLSEWVLL